MLQFDIDLSEYVDVPPDQHMEDGEVPSAPPASPVPPLAPPPAPQVPPVPPPGRHFAPVIVKQPSRRLVEIKAGQVIETRCSPRVAQLLGDVPRVKKPRPEPYVPGNRVAEIAEFFQYSLVEKYEQKIFGTLERDMRTRSRRSAVVFDYDDFKVPYSYGMGNPHDVLGIFLRELQAKRSVLIPAMAGDLYGVDFNIQRARAWSASVGAMRGIEVRFFW